MTARDLYVTPAIVIATAQWSSVASAMFIPSYLDSAGGSMTTYSLSLPPNLSMSLSLSSK